MANFFSSSAAHAADLGGKAVQSGGVDILAAWNSTPLTEVAMGALMLHKIAPKVAKTLLNEDSFAGRAASGKIPWTTLTIWRESGQCSPFKSSVLNHCSDPQGFLGYLI